MSLFQSKLTKYLTPSVNNQGEMLIKQDLQKVEIKIPTFKRRLTQEEAQRIKRKMKEQMFVNKVKKGYLGKDIECLHRERGQKGLEEERNLSPRSEMKNDIMKIIQGSEQARKIHQKGQIYVQTPINLDQNEMIDEHQGRQLKAIAKNDLSTRERISHFTKSAMEGKFQEVEVSPFSCESKAAEQKPQRRTRIRKYIPEILKKQLSIEQKIRQNKVEQSEMVFNKTLMFSLMNGDHKIWISKEDIMKINPRWITQFFISKVKDNQ